MQKLIQQWQPKDKLAALCGAISPLTGEIIWQPTKTNYVSHQAYSELILLVECSMNLFVKHSGKQGNACGIILVVGLKQVRLFTFSVSVDVFVFTLLSCKNTATFENNHVRFQGRDVFPQNPHLSSPPAHDELYNSNHLGPLTISSLYLTNMRAFVYSVKMNTYLLWGHLTLQ